MADKCLSSNEFRMNCTHPIPHFFLGGVKNNYMKMKLDFLFAWQNVWVGPPPPPPRLLRMILSAFRINNVEIK